MVQQRSDQEYWLIRNHYAMMQRPLVLPEKFNNNLRKNKLNTHS